MTKRMGETLKKIFIFVAGACVGVTISYKFFKNKYKQIANEEITSVKETFAKHYDNENDSYEDETAENDSYEDETVENDKEIQHDDVNEEDVIEYRNRVSIYVNNEEEKGEGENIMNEPYVISPDEFGNAGYDIVSLELYSDRVLVDEDDNPIEDIDFLVGEDSLEHFGEYEDDSVFVRNDHLKTDFEILLVEETYYDTDGNE